MTKAKQNSEKQVDPSDEGKAKVVSTARRLVSQEAQLQKLREKYKTEKARINATLKEVMERSLPVTPTPDQLSQWRGGVVQAWQRKLEVEEYAKEQLAVAGAEMKALRARLRKEIESVDQLDMKFD